MTSQSAKQSLKLSPITIKERPESGYKATQFNHNQAVNAETKIDDANNDKRCAAPFLGG